MFKTFKILMHIPQHCWHCCIFYFAAWKTLQRNWIKISCFTSVL